MKDFELICRVDGDRQTDRQTDITIIIFSSQVDVDGDQLLPPEPDPGGPHDGCLQLSPLLHLHERQVKL